MRAGACDRRAVAFDHAPIHARIFIVVEIAGRDVIELGAADICADRVDQAVPGVVWHQEVCGGNVRLPLRAFADPRKERLLLPAEFTLPIRRKPKHKRGTRPRWRSSVDRPMLFFGNLDPRVAVGGMEPAAAKIECKSRGRCNGPGAAAKPPPRLDDEAFDSRLKETPAGGDARRAAPDDYGLHIANRHLRIPALLRNDI